MNNAYKGKKIEFHILQSFPVTCLNRDDVGAPKTALIGGVTRARVSSQCWKRPVRLALQEFGIKIALRTKHISDIVGKKCLVLGATAEQAKKAGTAIAEVLSKDTLHFFTETEAHALAEFAQSQNYDISGKEKDIPKIHKQFFNPDIDGLDIALFGRMVANATELKVEAACAFAHAISTHKVSNEVEFFTALDDAKTDVDQDAGSAHMGTLEFNSATYYRYIGLDLGQLVETLGSDEHLEKAIEAFTKALFIAVPSARQTTQAGFSPWDYARIYLRHGQGLQASFDEPVRSRGEGYLKPSIEALNGFLNKKEKTAGSLFGKIRDWTWGLDENFSIDTLVSGLKAAVKG